MRAHAQHRAAEQRDDALDRPASRRVRAMLGHRRVRETNAPGRDPGMDFCGDFVDSAEHAAFRIGAGQDFAGIVQHHVAVAPEQHLEVVQQMVFLRDATNLREIGEAAARYDAWQAHVELDVDAADLRGRLQHDRDAVRDRERPVGGAGRQLVDVAQHREPALFELDGFIRVDETRDRLVAEHADRLSGAAVEHGLVRARAEHGPEEIRRIGAPCGIAVDVEIAVHAVDRQLAERRLAISGRRVAVHPGQVGRRARRADRVRMRGVDRALPEVRELRGRAFVCMPRRQDRRIARVGGRRIEQRERVRIDRLPVGAEQRAVGQRLGRHDRQTLARVDQHAAVAQERQRVDRRRPAGAERRCVVLDVGLRPRCALRLDLAHRPRCAALVMLCGAHLRRRHRACAACAAAIVCIAVERRIGLAAGAGHRRVGKRIGEPRDGGGIVRFRSPRVGFALQRVRQPHLCGDVDAAGQPDLVACLERVELRARLGFERRAREPAAAAVVEPERALDGLDRMQRFVREYVGHRFRPSDRAVDRHALAFRIDPAAAAGLADAHAPAVAVEHPQLRRQRARLQRKRADLVRQRRAADAHPHARDQRRFLHERVGRQCVGRHRVGRHRIVARRLQQLGCMQLDPAQHAALDGVEPLPGHRVRNLVVADRSGIADQEVARAGEDALQVEADLVRFEHFVQLHDVPDAVARDDGRQRARREFVAMEHTERADQRGDDAAERAKRPVQLHGPYAEFFECLQRPMFVDHDLLVGRALRIDRRRRLRRVDRGRAVIDRDERGVVAEREARFARACAKQFAEMLLDVDSRTRVAVEMNAVRIGREFAERVRRGGRGIEAVEHARVEQCRIVADRTLGRRVDRAPQYVREPRGGFIAAVLRREHDRFGILDEPPRRIGDHVFVHADRLAVDEQRAVGQRVRVQHDHPVLGQLRRVSVAARVQFGCVGHRATVAERRREHGMRMAPRGALVEMRAAARRGAVALGEHLRRRHAVRNAAAALLARPDVVVELAVGLCVVARYRRIGEAVGEPLDGARVVVRRALPVDTFARDRFGQRRVFGDVDAARQRDFVARLERVDLRACLRFERLAREAAAIAVVDVQHTGRRFHGASRLARERVRDAAGILERPVDRHHALARVDVTAAAALADLHAPAGIAEHPQLRRERRRLHRERLRRFGQRCAAEANLHPREPAGARRGSIGRRGLRRFRMGGHEVGIGRRCGVVCARASRRLCAIRASGRRCMVLLRRRPVACGRTFRRIGTFRPHEHEHAVRRAEAAVERVDGLTRRRGLRHRAFVRAALACEHDHRVVDRRARRIRVRRFVGGRGAGHGAGSGFGLRRRVEAQHARIGAQLAVGAERIGRGRIDGPLPAVREFGREQRIVLARDDDDRVREILRAHAVERRRVRRGAVADDGHGAVADLHRLRARTVRHRDAGRVERRGPRPGRLLREINDLDVDARSRGCGHVALAGAGRRLDVERAIPHRPGVGAAPVAGCVRRVVGVALLMLLVDPCALLARASRAARVGGGARRFVLRGRARELARRGLGVARGGVRVAGLLQRAVEQVEPRSRDDLRRGAHAAVGAERQAFSRVGQRVDARAVGPVLVGSRYDRQLAVLAEHHGFARRQRFARRAVEHADRLVFVGQYLVADHQRAVGRDRHALAVERHAIAAGRQRRVAVLVQQASDHLAVDRDRLAVGRARDERPARAIGDGRDRALLEAADGHQRDVGEARLQFLAGLLRVAVPVVDAGLAERLHGAADAGHDRGSLRARRQHRGDLRRARERGHRARKQLAAGELRGAGGAHRHQIDEIRACAGVGKRVEAAAVFGAVRQIEPGARHRRADRRVRHRRAENVQRHADDRADAGAVEQRAETFERHPADHHADVQAGARQRIEKAVEAAFVMRGLRYELQRAVRVVAGRDIDRAVRRQLVVVDIVVDVVVGARRLVDVLRAVLAGDLEDRARRHAVLFGRIDHRQHVHLRAFAAADRQQLVAHLVDRRQLLLVGEARDVVLHRRYGIRTVARRCSVLNVGLYAERDADQIALLVCGQRAERYRVAVVGARARGVEQRVRQFAAMRFVEIVQCLLVVVLRVGAWRRVAQTLVEARVESVHQHLLMRRLAQQLQTLHRVVRLGDVRLRLFEQRLLRIRQRHRRRRNHVVARDDAKAHRRRIRGCPVVVVFLHRLQRAFCLRLLDAGLVECRIGRTLVDLVRQPRVGCADRARDDLDALHVEHRRPGRRGRRAGGLRQQERMVEQRRRR